MARSAVKRQRLFEQVNLGRVIRHRSRLDVPLEGREVVLAGEVPDDFRFDFATCTATVAQLEACLKAQSDAAAVASEAASCADLSKPPGDYPAPAACSEIESICPGASS